MSNRVLCMAGATLWLTVSCGGVSEERIGALEAQLSQLQAQSTSGGEIASGDTDGLEARITEIDTSNKEAIANMQTVLDAIQKEVAGMSSAAGDGASGAAGGTSGPWYDVKTVLGIAGEGVTAEENQFKVSRAWLMQQIRTLTAGGKYPKLAENRKGGVSIKGLRPKTMFDQLGLKNNDAVLQIGATEITAPVDILAGLQAANGSEPLVVKIMRRKKELELQYTLED